ncbi:MAG: sulfotransferase [Alphaproteobacteria bacterium]|nr:sulfotransferase [Alphaproteobacteria bacterium]
MSGKQLFFVCGVVRSGTTWLQLLLDTHPEIACRGEGHFFSSLYENLGSLFIEHNRYMQRVGGTPGAIQFIQADVDRGLVATITSVMNRWADQEGIVCIGEKTPSNLAYMARIKRLLPTAKFIHIIRDGRDCAVSAWLRNMAVNKKAMQEKDTDFSSFVTEAANNWSTQMREARQFARENIGDLYHELRYEDLMREPERTLSRVLAFLQIDQSRDVVAACLKAARFETLSEGRQKGHEDCGAFYRKGIIGDWANHFSDKDAEVYEEIAGDALRELGYEVSN